VWEGGKKDSPENKDPNLSKRGKIELGYWRSFPRKNGRESQKIKKRKSFIGIVQKDWSPEGKE